MCAVSEVAETMVAYKQEAIKGNLRACLLTVYVRRGVQLNVTFSLYV